MAPKYIGKTLSGGAMALCIILLFTPETYSQTRARIAKMPATSAVAKAAM